MEEIGRGSFGTLFKVNDKRDEKIYAIKKITFKDESEDKHLKDLIISTFITKFDEKLVKKYNLWFKKNFQTFYIQMESFDLTIDKDIIELNEKLLNEFLTSTTIEKFDEKYIVKYFDVWFENKYNIIDGNKILEKNFSFYIQMEFCDKTLREIIEEMNDDSNLCTNQT